MRRPLTVLGRISRARTQRGSVKLVSTTGFHHASLAPAFCVHGMDLMTMSGSVWPYILAKFQPCSFGHTLAAGMSFGSPFGAPASTHFTIVSISLSESDRSFSNSVMPTVLSMCQGGIAGAATRPLIARAQGLASSTETSDIAAMESGRWQASHLFWKIGAMSLVKVGDCAAAATGTARTANSPRDDV